MEEVSQECQSGDEEHNDQSYDHYSALFEQEEIQQRQDEGHSKGDKQYSPRIHDITVSFFLA
jgi:hypothetical protein